MPLEKDKTLEFNQYMKSDKIACIIYVDIESLILKIDGCANNVFECLGENTERYKSFSIPIKKEVTKIDKDENESDITISYKRKFIHSARFMATSLSNLHYQSPN